MTADIEPHPEHPALSVVIPTLGRPMLIRTIQSLVAAEGFDRIEVLAVGRIADADVRRQLRALCETHARIRHLDVSYETGDSSKKKNTGWRAARAERIAFLDDDVTVAPDWPVRIVDGFDSPDVALVSGPSLTPPDVNLFSRLAGLALSSPAVGYVAWRYRRGEGDDTFINWSKIIGCNMAFRKSVLEEVDGFDPDFWPGEELVTSYRTQKKGYRLIFLPKAYVYHYPRTSLVRFWRQIFGYGSTRIRLVRTGVELEPTTLIPALWVATLVVAGVGSFFHPVFPLVLWGVLAAYALVDLGITLVMVRETRRVADLLIFLLIPIMHVSYGLAGWAELFRPGKDFGEEPHTAD